MKRRMDKEKAKIIKERDHEWIVALKKEGHSLNYISKLKNAVSMNWEYKQKWNEQAKEAQNDIRRRTPYV